MNNNNDAQVNDRLLKVKDIQEIMQLSRSAVYAAIRAGLLPRPIKIGKSSPLEGLGDRRHGRQARRVVKTLHNRSLPSAGCFFYFTMTPAPNFAGLRHSQIQQVYQ